MTNIIYLTAGLIALCGLCFLWDVALRRLFLDTLRERVFQLRFQLFELGMSGELPFESETYRSLEILLNGVLRFAYRFTLFTYIFSLREQAKARKAKDYQDIGQQIMLKITRTEPSTQAKLQELLEQLHYALIMYMAFTSLFFMVGALIHAVLRSLKFVGAKSENAVSNVSNVLEQEAYRAEMRQPQLATA